MKKGFALLILGSAILGISCGGGGNNQPPPPPPAVVIRISPTTSTVDVAATVQFTATVQNTSDTAVTWQVNDVEGGNTTVGTISASGLYTAPAMVPSPATTTVKAIAHADTTKSATSSVSVKPHVTISPQLVTVPAGGTQDFTATVQGVTDTAVTWQVNGVAGGNATWGTITTGGTYTAPLAIPEGGQADVIAVAHADTTRGEHAAVTLTHSSAMLNGSYAFSFMGWDPDQFYMAGSMVANGNGTITNGQVDYSGTYNQYYSTALTGTYSVNADGRVQFLLQDSVTTSYTLRAVIISPSRLRIIQFDTWASGQGTMDRQDPTAFNNLAFAGGRAFRMDGLDNYSYLAGTAGRVTADGAGNLTGGVLDINEEGVSILNVTFTGTYDVSSSGRGMMTFNTSSGELGSMNVAFYVVSPGRAHLISLDYLPWMIGAAELQTQTTFSNANLNGNFAFSEAGYSYNGLYYQAGRFTVNGNGGVTNGVADENDGWYATENLAFSGTYSVLPDGHGTATFTTSRGTSDYSFFMISPGRAFSLNRRTDALATGEIDAQSSASFGTASLAGNFGLSMTGGSSDSVVQFTANGAGSATGTADICAWYETGPAPLADQTFTATYSVTSNGRGNITITTPTGSTVLHLYMVTWSRVIVIGVDDNLLGTAEWQF